MDEVNQFKVSGDVRISDILSMLFNGYNQLQIASKLKITRKTVEYHLGNFMRKYEVHSAYEIVEWAIENGYLKDPKVDITKYNVPPRELQVLKLTGEGLNTKEIASELKTGIENINSIRLSTMKRFGIKQMIPYTRLAFSCYDSLKNINFAKLPKPSFSLPQVSLKNISKTPTPVRKIATIMAKHLGYIK